VEALPVLLVAQINKELNAFGSEVIVAMQNHWPFDRNLNFSGIACAMALITPSGQ